MSSPADRIASLRTALEEVRANRQAFSQAAYHQIVLALNSQLHQLEPTPPFSNPPISDSDEIRLVTVMFVDVVDSTLLAQNLGDDWKTMISEVHQRIALVLEEWGGEIGQYLGDGVLCFFGAHRSRDDDAVRSVSCALAIQSMAAAYAPTVLDSYGQAFALRVGISTGRVVVGVIGTETKREFVALGATTNLAARLQALCPANRVAIDAHTYRRVRDHYTVEPQSPAALKGFDDPVQYYLVGQRQRPTREPARPGPADLRLPFTGRETELSYLIQVFDDAVAEGHLHVVTVFGETGVGKTRLLHEALARVKDRPFYVLSITLRDDRHASVCNVLYEILASLCNLAENAPPDVARKRLTQVIRETFAPTNAEQVADTLGRMAGFTFADEVTNPGPGYALVAQLLRHLAGNRPLLFIIDNLQWADPESIALLNDVAAALIDLSGIIVGAARQEFRAARQAYLPSGTRSTEMVLGRLSDTATRRLIADVFERVERAPALLADHVCRRAEGNPLFVEEFFRMLHDNDVLEPLPDGRWRASMYAYATMSSALPSGLTGVFQARLDDLPATARRVVQIASVIGQTFWDGAAAYVSGFDTGPILAELAARGIVVATAESSLPGLREYHFRHALYHEVAYNMLTRIDRETYHQRAAQWLAGYTLDRPDLLGLQAQHLAEAQQREQALSVYLSAAEDRARRGLAAETLKLVESGLASARDLPRALAVTAVSQLWMWQGYALNLLKRYGEATAAGKTALMLMDELPREALAEQRALAASILSEAELHLTPTN